MKFIAWAFSVCVMAPLMGASAQAQTFPDKTITLVVPYGAGSVNDAAGRIIGAKMGEILGVSVVVENRPGANTVLGALSVARAAPNGYTLLLTTAASTVQNPLIYKKLSYSTEDFEPISQLTKDGNVGLVVNPSIPARTVKEFVDHARQHPGQLNYGSIGMGSTQHVYMELLKNKAGIQMVHVPHKATPPAELDLMRGDLAAMFDGIGTATPLAKSGKLRILAVTGTRRIPIISDVPTMAEAGFEGFEATSWVGLYAPARTPKAILDSLSAASVRAVQSDDVKAKLDTIGLFPLGTTRQEFIDNLKRDTELWRKVFLGSKFSRIDIDN